MKNQITEQNHRSSIQSNKQRDHKFLIIFFDFATNTGFLIKIVPVKLQPDSQAEQSQMI